MKISIIGAGSSTFSLRLVRDICMTPSLKDCTISLMDIDEARLNGVYGLCKRYSEEMDIKLNLEKTTDRRKTLEGADFVINTALAAGGHQRLLEGWSIAMKHGYRFGGSLHIVHDEAFWINFYQLQLMESIICDMMEICPDAWCLMVSNPVMAGITYLKRKYKNAKIIGLCHGYSGVLRLAKKLGLDPKKISYELTGVNHLIWLTHFTYEGQDAFPILNKWIEDQPEEYWRNCKKSYEFGLKAIDLYKKFGVFPIGDTSTPGGGSWPYWYHTDETVEEQWNEDPYSWYKSYFHENEQRADDINLLAADLSRNVTDVFPPMKSNEPMIPIIESITYDIPRVIIVNMLNDGDFVPGVPRDFEVEIPALVSKRGIQGIKTNGLPKELISNILRDRVSSVEMELQAFQSGKKELLLNLIMMDPWTRSEEQARNLLDEIMALPYNKEIKDYYK